MLASRHAEIPKLIDEFETASGGVRVHVINGQIQLFYEGRGSLPTSVHHMADRIERILPDGSAIVEKDRGGRSSNVPIPRSTEPARPTKAKPPAPVVHPKHEGPATWHSHLLDEDE